MIDVSGPKKTFEEQATYLCRLREIFFSARISGILNNPGPMLNLRIPEYTTLLVLAKKLDAQAEEIGNSLLTECPAASLINRMGGRDLSPGQRMHLVQEALKDRRSQLEECEEQLASIASRHAAALSEYRQALAAGENPSKEPEASQFLDPKISGARRQHFTTVLADLEACRQRAAKEMLVETLRGEAEELRSVVEVRMNSQHSLTHNFLLLLIDMIDVAGSPEQLKTARECFAQHPDFEKWVNDGTLPSQVRLTSDGILKERCSRSAEVKLREILGTP